MPRKSKTVQPIRASNPLVDFFSKFPKEMSEQEKQDHAYPFRVCCAWVRRRPPRHEGFEYIRDMGMPNIARVFNNEPLSNPEELTFMFPERWMGLAEQQAFTNVLSKHHQVKQIKRVNIATSSPLIVGSFIREQVLVYTWDDDDQYNGDLGRFKDDPALKGFGG